MDIQKEREAPNTEFNETMNLVEAVLERLEFHAFEQVSIWSNEHASRALTICLKKTLNEFKSGELILTSSYPKLDHFSVDNVVRGLLTTIDQAQERQENLNREIDELKDQLTKAQAVPNWIDYEKQSPHINGRYQIFIEGEQIAADWENHFGFSCPISGEALIQEKITHWSALGEDPKEPANE